MTIPVFTHQYQSSHRQHPRGFGSWAFTFRRGGQWTTEPTFCHGILIAYLVWGTGTADQAFVDLADAGQEG